MKIEDLKVKIFADGADISGMLQMYKNTFIKGFTTNPTLMRKAGITNYEKFAKEIISLIPDRPISFEVFSDNPREMVIQGRKIAQWGENVNVKIPITNSEGLFLGEVVRELSKEGIKTNITAIFTVEQSKRLADYISHSVNTFVSVFAGRIADTGRDPKPIVREVIGHYSSLDNVSVIWASPREAFNIIEANDVGCQIITATNEILSKLNLLQKDLAQFSLETVQMFLSDARASGFEIS